MSRHGAALGARDMVESTPLHHAALGAAPAAAELLLALGADPDARDEDGDAPLDNAEVWSCAQWRGGAPRGRAGGPGRGPRPGRAPGGAAERRSAGASQAPEVQSSWGAAVAQRPPSPAPA